MQLFASSDKYERANGSVYREHEIALPNELTLEQLHELVDALVRRLAGNKPYMYAVHQPTSALQSEMNTHIHLMVVDRVPDGIERPAEQMFSRFNAKHPERGGCRKDSGGRTPLQVRHGRVEDVCQNGRLKLSCGCSGYRRGLRVHMRVRNVRTSLAIYMKH